jgi:NAD(P)-dependent dehydrogenase (short-subunit alcohol dehydrogenase family)
MGRLDQKTAIITGGGSGIGRACALRLTQEGANVAVGDIRDKLAGETVEKIHQAGGNAIAVHCDVGSEEQVKMMYSSAIEEFGGLDILVRIISKTID